MLRNCGAVSRSLSCETTINHGHTCVENLWRQFFADPSQWWDHSIEKVNPKYPDFKHKQTGVGLWLNGRSNPPWVKTELKSLTPGSASRSLYSWNAMLSECVKAQRGQDALELYNQMQAHGVKPDALTFIRLLSACVSLGALAEGKRVHEQLSKNGCESDVFVGNSLVHMYSKCGSLEDAERVFDTMPNRNVVSWTAMLGGYVKCHEGQKALDFYRQMLAEGVQPNPVTFVVLLNACASIMALDEGRRVHAQLIENGCENDMFVASTLVDMYAKCGSIQDAERVFQSMHRRDVVSWNAMLTGYVKCGEGRKALELFPTMEVECVKPNPVTFVALLNACAMITALEEGRRVHLQAIQSDCEPDLFVGNSLVDMYAKCESLKDAERVFHKMPTRNVISWTTMLAGYGKWGQGKKALELFQQMQAESVQPNPVTFVTILNACSSVMALEEGRGVHAQVIQGGYESDVFVGNALLDMYAKCKMMSNACSVFHTMPSHDVVSWNTMIAGFVECTEGEKALELYQQMQTKGVKPNSITYAVVLNACAILMALEEGQAVHLDVIQSDFESDAFVGSALVDMYAKCGSLKSAQRVFHTMPSRDVVAWSAIMIAHVKCDQSQKALDLFKEMQAEGVTPNPVTFVAVLKACATVMDLEEGRCVHRLAIQSGCECDAFVRNSLVDMYGTCGSIEDAYLVFHGMRSHDVISWNAMLAGYMKCAEAQRVLEQFQQMQAEGVKPNPVTFVVVLNACTYITALEEGRHVHAQAMQCGWESDVFVGSALVNMYGKCGRIEDAERVFHTISTRDVVFWNAMLTAYAKCGEGKKGLQLFQQMQAERVKPNSVTFVVVLNVCAGLMALEEGRRIHAQVVEAGCEPDVCVGSTLVDMYAKCGTLDDAHRVFCAMPNRNVVSWTAMLGGFAMHGLGKEACQLFEEMHKAGVEMNVVTFVCLLSACSHGGLVEEGINLFESMGSVYGISPTAAHYGCMIDLLGRSGHLDEAEDLLTRHPVVFRNSVALMALLGACRIHCNLERVECVTHRVFQLEPNNAACYGLLSNVCAAAGQWGSSAKIKPSLKEKKRCKEFPRKGKLRNIHLLQMNNVTLR